MNIIAIPGFSEPFSSATHLLAAFAALVGLFYLWHKGRGNALRITSLVGFSLTLMFLFSMSGVYHLLDPAFLPREVLQRLDHAAIWTLIAGTFTPIHIILFRGKWRWAVLGIVWTIAITSLVLEVIFFEDIPEWASLAGYLGLGWIGVFTTRQFIKMYDDPSIHLLWLGGLAYSTGAILEFLRWPVFFPGVVEAHEVFHIFVILGAFFHWLFVFRWAHYPTKDNVEFHIEELPEKGFVANSVDELIRLEAATEELLREKIREAILFKFHKNRMPTIRLKFFVEEALTI